MTGRRAAGLAIAITVAIGTVGLALAVVLSIVAAFFVAFVAGLAVVGVALVLAAAVFFVAKLERTRAAVPRAHAKPAPRDLGRHG